MHRGAGQAEGESACPTSSAAGRPAAGGSACLRPTTADCPCERVRCQERARCREKRSDGRLAVQYARGRDDPLRCVTAAAAPRRLRRRRVERRRVGSQRVGRLRRRAAGSVRGPRAAGRRRRAGQLRRPALRERRRRPAQIRLSGLRSACGQQRQSAWTARCGVSVARSRARPLSPEPEGLQVQGARTCGQQERPGPSRLPAPCALLGPSGRQEPVSLRRHRPLGSPVHLACGWKERASWSTEK